MGRVGVAGVGDVLTGVAPNSIACAACAIIVPARLEMIHTPSTRSFLASARTLTKPSVSRSVFARPLAMNGNFRPVLETLGFGLFFT